MLMPWNVAQRYGHAAEHLSRVAIDEGKDAVLKELRDRRTLLAASTAPLPLTSSDTIVEVWQILLGYVPPDSKRRFDLSEHLADVALGVRTGDVAMLRAAKQALDSTDLAGFVPEALVAAVRDEFGVKHSNPKRSLSVRGLDFEMMAASELATPRPHNWQKEMRYLVARGIATPRLSRLLKDDPDTFGQYVARRGEAEQKLGFSIKEDYIVQDVTVLAHLERAVAVAGVIPKERREALVSGIMLDRLVPNDDDGRTREAMARDHVLMLEALAGLYVDHEGLEGSVEYISDSILEQTSPSVLRDDLFIIRTLRPALRLMTAEGWDAHNILMMLHLLRGAEPTTRMPRRNDALETLRLVVEAPNPFTEIFTHVRDRVGADALSYPGWAGWVPP